MGDVIIRQCRLKYFGIKCHAVCSFGMIHEMKWCECVGTVREEANAAKYGPLRNLSEGHMCVYLHYSVNFSRRLKFFKIRAEGK